MINKPYQLKFVAACISVVIALVASGPMAYSDTPSVPLPVGPSAPAPAPEPAQAPASVPEPAPAPAPATTVATAPEPTPAPTPTPTASASPTPTPTPTPTASASPEPKSTPTASPTPSPTPTATRAPAFTLSASREKVWANDRAIGFTVRSTGGPAIFEIYPEAPAGITFDPNTGSFSGIPTVPQPPIEYVVIGVNSRDKATRSFTFEVANPLALSVTTRSSRTSNNAAFGVQPQVALTNKGAPNRVSNVAITASVSQGARLLGTTSATAYAGVGIFDNLGITGTIGTRYTITYSAPGHISATEVITPVLYSIGDTGPAGGIVFYISNTAFKCGYQLERMCNYLEAPPTTGQFAWTDFSAPWSRYSVEFRADSGISKPSSAIGGGCSNTRLVTALSGGVQVLENLWRYRSNSLSSPASLRGEWCLPSVMEMAELIKQRTVVGALDRNQIYWTSTWSVGTTDAEAFLPGTNLHLGMDVTMQNFIRPVRAF